MSSLSSNFVGDLKAALETTDESTRKTFAERFEGLILTIQKQYQEIGDGAKEPVPCPFCGQATTNYFCGPNLHVHLNCEQCKALLMM